jgi:hypothetical protein
MPSKKTTIFSEFAGASYMVAECFNQNRIYLNKSEEILKRVIYQALLNKFIKG